MTWMFLQSFPWKWFLTRLEVLSLHEIPRIPPREHWERMWELKRLEYASLDKLAVSNLN